MEPIKYIAQNERDEQWGLTICSVGYQKVGSNEVYPPKKHNQEYLFRPENGRILSEYQLLYIVEGEGVLCTRHSGRHVIKSGDMFLLFPGEWHTYQPSSDGWKEYWIGFQGANIDLRVQNGQEKPWNVKFWGVGNEAWGCGGNMTPEYYVGEYRRFATFMEGQDLFKVASGANVDDYHWTETLMKGIPLRMLDGITLHHYSFPTWEKKGPATGYSEQEYFETMKTALRMDELIIKHTAIMDKYDPNKKIALVVDEWGGWFDVEQGTNPGFLYQQNTMRDAMIAGATLNIFNNHSDRVKIANLAQCVNVLQSVILTDKEKMLLTPTYHVMEMYKIHQDATLIPVEVKTSDYVFGKEKLPAVSVSASKSTTGLTHVSLVNIHSSKSEEIEIDITGEEYKNVSGRILTSKKVDDHNTFDQPERIKPAAFSQAKLKGGKLKVTVPPFSLVVLALN